MPRPSKASLLWLALGTVGYVAAPQEFQYVAWFTIGNALESLGCVGFDWKWPEPCSSPESLAAISNTSGLKVILPSIGQTGTTSVIQALRMLGFRSYHIEEKMLFSPALHYEGATPEAWAWSASRCRLDAITLEPATDALWLAAASSPEAKFIMTWRDYPSRTRSSEIWEWDVWYRGVFNHFADALRYFPWLHVYDALTGQVSRVLREGDPFSGEGETSVLLWYMYRVLGLYDHELMRIYTRGSFKDVGYSEYAYLAHMNEIYQVVPSERLLVFDVKKHGWAEIERFLGLPPRFSGMKFPQTRSKRSWTNDQTADNRPWMAVRGFLLLSLLHVANCAIFALALRLPWLLLWRLLLEDRGQEAKSAGAVEARLKPTQAKSAGHREARSEPKQAAAAAAANGAAAPGPPAANGGCHDAAREREAEEEEAAAAEEEEEEELPAPKCKRGHDLALFVTPEANYVCDSCHRKQATGSNMYACRPCDYDLCATCVEAARRPAAPPPARGAVAVLEASEGRGSDPFLASLRRLQASLGQVRLGRGGVCVLLLLLNTAVALVVAWVQVLGILGTNDGRQQLGRIDPAIVARLGADPYFTAQVLAAVQGRPFGEAP